MAKLSVVYWRDIPAQVIAERGRGRGRGRRGESAKVELSDRFAKAIDAAAMRDDAGDADQYLEEWRRSDPIDCGDDLSAEASIVAERLETEFDAERLRLLIANGGRSA